MFIRSYSGTFNTFCNRSDVATNVHFEQKVEKYYIWSINYELSELKMNIFCNVYNILLYFTMPYTVILRW